jgi:hypothetical protein
MRARRSGAARQHRARRAAHDLLGDAARDQPLDAAAHLMGIVPLAICLPYSHRTVWRAAPHGETCLS